MDTVKIRNPRLNLLPKEILKDLNAVGKLKPLSYGKMKGFRIKYSRSNQGSRDEVFNILARYGIKVTAFTEQVMSGSGHLNIHEIEVFQNSVAYNAFLSQPEDKG